MMASGEETAFTGLKFRHYFDFKSEKQEQHQSIVQWSALSCENSVISHIFGIDVIQK